MSCEPSISSEKRGASPEALADEVPSSKRIQTVVSVAAGIPVSAQFTRLVNDPFINNLAHQLALDSDLVRLVKDLLEPLQNDNDEHVTLNLDAWKRFASLQIWQNQELCSALNQCSLQCPLTMIDTYLKQADLDQLFEEKMSYIKNHPSLELILEDREPVAMMRIVLIILIAFWSGKDVLGSDPDCRFATSLDSDPDCESAASLDSDPDYESTTSHDSGPMDSRWRSELGEEFMIDELIDAHTVECFADKVLKDESVVQPLEALLETLYNNSQHTLSNRAVEHFEKVKSIWGNRDFIRILLKDKSTPCSMLRYMRVAGRKLTEFLVYKIKGDPAFDDIFRYMEPTTMMRSALSILIGYWANEESILPLVYAMGGRAFGVKRVDLGDACLGVVKDNHLVSGEDRSEDKMCMESPSCSIIADLSQDTSIKKLADQLVQFPQAVSMAEELLESLKDDVPLRLSPYLHYVERHRCAALGFWCAPVIILHLIKELKESTALFSVFNKHIKGAQLLRCQERLTRIQKDPLLGSILESDHVTKIRGALSILFGYWSDKDVAMLVIVLLALEDEAFAEVDLTEENVEFLYYLTNKSGAVEGLKSVLADKYCEDSVEYTNLFEKIRIKEQDSMKFDNEKDLASIKVILKEGDIIYFSKGAYSRRN
ncbi:unnamed protein product [Cuscuta europaea]|nr:unnamed protein product [Cuscuta europaea]